MTVASTGSGWGSASKSWWCGPPDGVLVRAQGVEAATTLDRVGQVQHVDLLELGRRAELGGHHAERAGAIRPGRRPGSRRADRGAGRQRELADRAPRGDGAEPEEGRARPPRRRSRARAAPLKRAAAAARVVSRAPQSSSQRSPSLAPAKASSSLEPQPLPASSQGRGERGRGRRRGGLRRRRAPGGLPSFLFLVAAFWN